jgi:ABC-2 type transport system ATP-binding protein
MITTHNLTLTFKTLFSKPFVAVDHINFSVERGDIFGFLGPNGAGKTTTIRMLSTILTPTEGTAEVCGFDIVRNPLMAKSRIGLMPENPGFYGDMTALNQLIFYGEFYKIPKAECKRKANELLDMMRLTEFKNRKIKTYSHGMRKRVALAQALINDPQLLILDEPTGGLDPQGTHEFREMIKNLNKNGITIFLSSHILPEVQQICNKVGILNRGKIIAVDSLKNLANKLKIKSKVNIYVQGIGIIPKHLKGLLQIKGIEKYYSFGEGFNFVIEEGEEKYELASQINSYFVKNGVKVTTLQPSEPTLEEVFLEVTGEINNEVI